MTTATIYYVSAGAGSGKTHQLIDHAATLVKTQKAKVLIAQPTKALILQTLAEIQSKFPDVAAKTIYNAGDGKAVTPEIVEHMKQADPHNEQILLITHEALKRLPNAYRVHWDLFVDEIPAVFENVSLRVAKTHNHLTDLLDLEDITDKVAAVKIRDGSKSQMETLRVNKTGDQLLGLFGEIATHLLDDNRTVMVETAEYNALLNGKRPKGELNFFSLLRSEVVADYRSVTLMGANATETELFILWEALSEAQFVEHPQLSKGLRFTQHGNGHRLTVNFLFEHEWSISRSRRVDPQTGKTLLEAVGHFVQDHFAKRRFLWVVNKAAEMPMFDQNDRLPAVSHGLNKPHFQSCDAVVSLIALVRNHASAKFLGMLGLTDAQVRTVICYQSEYQAIMRCSLRDPKGHAPVAVIVPSRASAAWLASKFDGCTVAKLETGLDWELRKAGRPKGRKPPKTDAERMREMRKRKETASLQTRVECGQ
ncbi:DEAD/DEAH box helicase family protein [Sphingobium sp. WW5]|uniref:DEAD/DEAH box helicase family protein n=1 Tax=unclassified Sphingobium TaxID=2611147 RepID=UPI003C2812A8